MVRCLYCMQVVAEDSARACPHCGHVIPLRKENVLDLEPGTMLGGGRYLIGRSIGYGGFGRTYLAWDANLNTVCAVKEYYPQQLCTRVPHSSNVMVNSLNDRPGYDKGRKAFQEEAMRLLALSNVPGIVRVWDRFSENNTEYFVMELLQGGTLSKYIKAFQGPMPIANAVDMQKKLLLVVAALHNTRIPTADGKTTVILHRDISTDNIFVSPDLSKVTLIDFGSARAESAQLTGELTTSRKAGYTAPEQIAGEHQDKYTDIYATGVVFYRMLCGHVPTQPPQVNGYSVRTERPDVPPALDRLIQRATLANPLQRYQTAEEFLADLENWDKAKAPGPGPRRKDKGGSKALLIILALLVLLGGAFAALKLTGTLDSIFGGEPAKTPAVTEAPVTEAPPSEAPATPAPATDTPMPVYPFVRGFGSGLQDGVLTLYAYSSEGRVEAEVENNNEAFAPRPESSDNAVAEARYADGWIIVRPGRVGEAVITVRDGHDNPSFRVRVESLFPRVELAEGSTADSLKPGDSLTVALVSMDGDFPWDPEVRPQGAPVEVTDNGDMTAAVTVTGDLPEEGAEVVFYCPKSGEEHSLSLSAAPRPYALGFAQDSLTLYTDGMAASVGISMENAGNGSYAPTVNSDHTEVVTVRYDAALGAVVVTPVGEGTATVQLQDSRGYHELPVTVEALFTGLELAEGTLDSLRSGDSLQLRLLSANGSAMAWRYELQPAGAPVAVSDAGTAADGNLARVTITGDLPEEGAELVFLRTDRPEERHSVSLSAAPRPYASGFAQDSLTLYTDGEPASVGITLENAGNGTYAPTVNSDHVEVVTVRFDAARNAVVVTPVGEGTATVQLQDSRGRQDLRVTVQPLFTGVTVTEGTADSLKAGDRLTVRMNSAAGAFSWSWELQPAGAPVDVVPDGQDAVVSVTAELQDDVTLTFRRMDRAEEAHSLTLSAAPKPYAAGLEQDSLTLYTDGEGGYVPVRLENAGNGSYSPSVASSEPGVADAAYSADRQALAVTPLRAGETVVTLRDGHGEHTLRVTVLPLFRGVSASGFEDVKPNDTFTVEMLVAVEDNVLTYTAAVDPPNAPVSALATPGEVNHWTIRADGELMEDVTVTFTRAGHADEAYAVVLSPAPKPYAAGLEQESLTLFTNRTTAAVGVTLANAGNGAYAPEVSSSVPDVAAASYRAETSELVVTPKRAGEAVITLRDSHGELSLPVTVQPLFAGVSPDHLDQVKPEDSFTVELLTAEENKVITCQARIEPADAPVTASQVSGEENRWTIRATGELMTDVTVTLTRTGHPEEAYTVTLTAAPKPYAERAESDTLELYTDGVTRVMPVILANEGNGAYSAEVYSTRPEVATAEFDAAAHAVRVTPVSVGVTEIQVRDDYGSIRFDAHVSQLFTGLRPGALTGVKPGETRTVEILSATGEAFAWEADAQGAPVQIGGQGGMEAQITLTDYLEEDVTLTFTRTGTGEQYTLSLSGTPRPTVSGLSAGSVSVAAGQSAEPVTVSIDNDDGTLELTPVSADPAVATAVYDAQARTVTVTGHSAGSTFIDVGDRSLDVTVLPVLAGVEPDPQGLEGLKPGETRTVTLLSATGEAFGWTYTVQPADAPVEVTDNGDMTAALRVTDYLPEGGVEITFTREGSDEHSAVRLAGAAAPSLRDGAGEETLLLADGARSVTLPVENADSGIPSGLRIEKNNKPAVVEAELDGMDLKLTPKAAGQAEITVADAGHRYTLTVNVHDRLTGLTVEVNGETREPAGGVYSLRPGEELDILPVYERSETAGLVLDSNGMRTQNTMPSGYSIRQSSRKKYYILKAGSMPSGEFTVTVRDAHGGEVTLRFRCEYAVTGLSDSALELPLHGSATVRLLKREGVTWPDIGVDSDEATYVNKLADGEYKVSVNSVGTHTVTFTEAGGNAQVLTLTVLDRLTGHGNPSLQREGAAYLAVVPVYTNSGDSSRVELAPGQAGWSIAGRPAGKVTLRCDSPRQGGQEVTLTLDGSSETVSIAFPNAVVGMTPPDAVIKAGTTSTLRFTTLYGGAEGITLNGEPVSGTELQLGGGSYTLADAYGSLPFTVQEKPYIAALQLSYNGEDIPGSEITVEMEEELRYFGVRLTIGGEGSFSPVISDASVLTYEPTSSRRDFHTFGGQKPGSATITYADDFETHILQVRVDPAWTLAKGNHDDAANMAELNNALNVLNDGFYYGGSTWDDGTTYYVNQWLAGKGYAPNGSLTRKQFNEMKAEASARSAQSQPQATTAPAAAAPSGASATLTAELAVGDGHVFVLDSEQRLLVLNLDGTVAEAVKSASERRLFTRIFSAANGTPILMDSKGNIYGLGFDSFSGAALEPYKKSAFVRISGSGMTNEDYTFFVTGGETAAVATYEDDKENEHENALWRPAVEDGETVMSPRDGTDGVTALTVYGPVVAYARAGQLFFEGGVGSTAVGRDWGWTDGGVSPGFQVNAKQLEMSDRVLAVLQENGEVYIASKKVLGTTTSAALGGNAAEAPAPAMKRIAGGARQIALFGDRLAVLGTDGTLRLYDVNSDSLGGASAENVQAIDSNGELLFYLKLDNTLGTVADGAAVDLTDTFILP